MSSAQDQNNSQEQEEKQSEEMSDKGSDDYDQKLLDKPIEIRPYASQFLDQTIEEIEANIYTKRPLIKVQFIKKRRDFGITQKFTDSESSDRFIEIRQVQVDQLSHLQKLTIDIGLQGSSQMVSSASQTDWSRKVNKGLQIVDEAQYEELEDDDLSLEQFLKRVYPLMEENLQSNETIDIFQDDLDVLKDDGLNMEVSDMTNTIKEIKTCSHLSCKNKKVNCVQFLLPALGQSTKRIVADCFIENITFDERASLSIKSYNSQILFWDYEDIHLMKPILSLVSPIEITCFEFNPKDPNTVIAGGINGQVIIWDLKGFLSDKNLKKQQKNSQEIEYIPELEPCLMSALQDPSSVNLQSDIIRKNVPSHKNPILNIKWLPNTIQIDKRQLHTLHTKNLNGEYSQFASISEDGQVLFWDIQFGDKDPRKDKSILFKAIHGVQLYRPEGGGVMGGAQIQFSKNQKDSKFIGTSDEGDLFIIDWCARQVEEGAKVEMCQKIWDCERSFRPAVGMERSPFFDDIILTIHDFYFNIFQEDIDVPIFQSVSVKNAVLTCGGWCPSRPGVLMIGRSDGLIDIWDFVDQSHKYSLQHQVVTSGLSYLKFHEAMPQILGVGDMEGTLHILELPYLYIKKQGDEEKTMREFWDREVKRVKYYEQRFQLRSQQMKDQKEKQDREEQIQQALNSQQKNKNEKNSIEDELEQQYQQFVEEYCKEHGILLDNKSTATINNDKDKKK